MSTNIAGITQDYNLDIFETVSDEWFDQLSDNKLTSAQLRWIVSEIMIRIGLYGSDSIGMVPDDDLVSMSQESKNTLQWRYLQHKSKQADWLKYITIIEPKYVHLCQKFINFLDRISGESHHITRISLLKITQIILRTWKHEYYLTQFCQNLVKKIFEIYMMDSRENLNGLCVPTLLQMWKKGFVTFGQMGEYFNVAKSSNAPHCQRAAWEFIGAMYLCNKVDALNQTIAFMDNNFMSILEKGGQNHRDVKTRVMMLAVFFIINESLSSMFNLHNLSNIKVEKNYQHCFSFKLNDKNKKTIKMIAEKWQYVSNDRKIAKKIAALYKTELKNEASPNKHQSGYLPTDFASVVKMMQETYEDANALFRLTLNAINMNDEDSFVFQTLSNISGHGTVNSQVSSEFKTLFNNPKFNDCKMRVGNVKDHGCTRLFWVNRSILACHSPVFAKQFFDSQFSETTNPNSVISVTDVSPDAFYFMLKLFHFDDPQITSKNCIDILYLCEKYMLSNEMKTLCLKFIHDIMITSPQLFVELIFSLKLKGLFDLFFTKMFENEQKSTVYPNFNAENCKILLFYPKLLYFDENLIKKIIFESDILVDRSESVASGKQKSKYIVSMENQWNFINRYCKFQTFLEIENNNNNNNNNKENEKNNHNNNNNNSNDSNKDDEKKSETVVTSLDDEDDEYDEKKIDITRNGYEANNKGNKIDSLANGNDDSNNSLYDIDVINGQINGLNMTDDKIATIWAQKMIKFFDILDFKVMDAMFFAFYVLPCVQRICQLTGNPQAAILMQQTRNEINPHDEWFRQ